ncbi:maleylpyruvate isomerase family mycothiol-dependent enzyme [Sphaerisporangium album]|uniref:Maleylpyruvate isomerase family mycothiol-dependent enzyme n=1 Tax=Sphaerisporangium album TaxID=509200 RepID=A0A367F9F4_9ACTN|nr:maleylpyruvate isomerase family mycothiol-dependent enzyme [Sphaerisporangium album]RCG26984.1 maleylpyruvate isomerase family mycothiol-dependent enzyme [Sphaerisporangium album]
MAPLGHDRYCDEIINQSGMLRELVKGFEPSVPVPTCPGWTLAALVRHIGGNLRTVGTAVRTGTPVSDPAAQVDGLAGPGTDDWAELDPWFSEGAETYTAALRAAGPDAEATVWGFQGNTTFWVRRAVHDIVVHRADVALAVGGDYAVAPELAADAIDELLELFKGQQAGGMPPLAELRGTGETIGLQATDADAAWLITLGADGFTSGRAGGEAATVTVRGPLIDVLLTLYRRLPADGGRVKVLGDSALLDFWLARASLS